MAKQRINWNKVGEGGKRYDLYGSARWKRMRARYLKANPVCRACGSKATVVDHIHGHGPGWEDRFWIEAGWQPLCRPCHERKTGNEHRLRHGARTAGVGMDENVGGGRYHRLHGSAPPRALHKSRIPA